MIRITRVLQSYLIFSLPFVVALMLWSGFQPTHEIETHPSFFLRALWEIGSWNLILWFTTLIVFLVLTVLHPSAREHALRRIANLKERDEREELITARAARSSYISTMSFLMFLLFISIFQVNLTKIPDDQVVGGKHHALSIGLSFPLFDESISGQSSSDPASFDSKNYSLSKPAVLLALLIWQLSSFTLSMRKQLKEEQ